MKLCEISLYFSDGHILFTISPGTYKKPPAEAGGLLSFYVKLINNLNYSWGPAATRALPSSLPVYLVKFLMKRADRS